MNNGNTKEKICRHCGKNLSAFLSNGFLGCNYCYVTFAEEIQKMLPSMQLKSVNKGKRCDGTLFDKDLLAVQLRQMRDFAADEQRYTDAEIINRQLMKLSEVKE